MREISKLSVILPFYNEKGNLKEMIRLLRSCLEGLSLDYEIICVNDGSEDNSQEEVFDEKLSDPRIKLIQFTRNFGKDAAIFAGLYEAVGDALVTLDSDGQHPVSLLPQMINAYRESDKEVIEAVRLDRDSENFIKRSFVTFSYWLFKRLTDLDLRNQTDYRLLSRFAANKILSVKEKRPFFRAISNWMNFDRVQIYFEIEERKYGSKKYTLYNLFKLGIYASLRYSSRPLLILPISSVVFFLFSLIVGVRELLAFLNGGVVDGVPTIIFLILFNTSIILFFLSLISLYIAMIFDQALGSPLYIKKSEDN